MKTDIEFQPEEESVISIPFCSFCGHSEDDVRWLIAGPMSYICDECVDTCNETIRGLNRAAAN